MASPARQVRTRAGSPSPSPSRVRTTPSSQRPALRVVKPATRRRRNGVRFWVLAGTLIGLMVLALTVLYALIAQGSFEMSELTAQQRTLTRTNTDLRIEIVELSSTRRISSWAEDHHLVMPAGYEVITAADIRSADGPSRDRTGGDG